MKLKPAWTLIASFVAIAVLIPAFAAQGMSWPEAAATTLCFVASGIVMIWVAWNYLLTRPGARSVARAFTVHASSALGFALLWTLAFAGLMYTFLQPVADRDGFGQGLVWLAVWALVIYAALAQLARAYANLRERELAAMHAELAALRAQLDPHFLFNTLHSLTQLAREDPGATAEALERFGSLMRYVLRAGKDVTTDIALEDELAFVEDYLALEKLRLGERLKLERDIDPDTVEFGVPPLLLQPLVENALRHGISPRVDGGTVRLSAQLINDRLQIAIADDGQGAEPDAWRNSGGLGLRAASRQLEARYGRAATIDIRTRPGKGFTVLLSIPARVPGAAT